MSHNPYDIAIRHVQPLSIMSIRFITSIEKIGQDIPNAYKELQNYITAQKGIMTGEYLAIYHDPGFNPFKIDVECCFGVSPLLVNRERIKGRVADGGEMAVALHKGPYKTIYNAHDALLQWISDNNYTPLAQMREHYLNDPAEVAPEEILTEVFWPVQKNS